MNVAHQSIQYTQRKKVQSKHVLAVLAAPKARRCLDSQIPIDPIGTYWNILEPDSERMSPFSAPRRWSSPMFHIPHSTSFDILRHPSTSFDHTPAKTPKQTGPARLLQLRHRICKVHLQLLVVKPRSCIFRNIAQLQF